MNVVRLAAGADILPVVVVEVVAVADQGPKR